MSPSTIDTFSRAGAPQIEFDRSVSLTRDATRKAYGYWKSVTGDRPWPSRKDISPRGMKDFVKHIGLIEVRPGRLSPTYAVRIAGGIVENVFGSIGGKTLSEFLPASIEARWRIIFDTMLEARAPIRISTRVSFGGRDYLATEALIAPLGEPDGISMILAAVDIWPAVAPAQPGRPAGPGERTA
ncbi:MAG TPA: PAS domain-containing protein [Rhizomicrobium sp.]|nr:PAS domain-containing protein [Rhizomicrobium sp.]